MKIKADGNKTIVSKLTDILNNTLPLTAVTGLNKDLSKIKSDPKSKGKSVLFSWRKGTYRLSENLKVMELDFTNSYVENEVSKEVEAMIKANLINIDEKPEAVIAEPILPIPEPLVIVA